MNKLVMLLALSPSLASAEKTFDNERKVTWDCSKDAVVTINQGNGSYAFSGACKKISINGGHDKVTIDSVETLDVTGSWNEVTASSVDSIRFMGSDNKVAYKKGAGKVNDLGSNNKVAGGGKTPEKPVDKPTAKSDDDDADDRAAVGNHDCARDPSPTINAAAGTLTFTGTCDKITINGGANKATIENVKQLAINGATNQIEIGGVDKIAVVGAENKVTYKKGLSVKKPEIGIVGANNAVKQK